MQRTVLTLIEKPENIEIAVAEIGSTHPEELREHRRKLLTITQTAVRPPSTASLTP